jgi:hypothetical protein
MKIFIATFLAILAAAAVIAAVGVVGNVVADVRQRKLENSPEYQRLRAVQRQRDALEKGIGNIGGSIR